MSLQNVARGDELFFPKSERNQQNFTIMSVALGDKPSSYTTVKNWVARFRRGHLSTVNKERSGRPSEVTVPENMDVIHSMILDDQRISAEKIAETLMISLERILSKLFLLKTFTIHCGHTLSKKSPGVQIFGVSNTMASSTVRKRIIAVCQMTATNNKEDNVRTCSELIKSAKEKNCMMVFLPEACDYIGESKEETVRMAQPLSGDLIKTFCSLAKENNIWLSLGGVHEQANGEKVHNSHAVIDGNGDIVALYRKAHLFDLNIAEKGIRLMESDYVLPGQTILPPIKTPIGKLGLSVCYDIRFPELSLMLANMGADILTFPSAFTYVTGAAHWETLLRARAIESQCYVVAAAQTGSHNNKRTSWGHAMVVDPWGNVVAQCSENTNIATAELNLDYIQDIRTSMPIWQHRRNDLYRVLEPKKMLEDQQEYTFGNAVLSSENLICKTANTVAFISSNSIVPGHVLVMPLRHVSRLSSLNSEELFDMFSVVERVQSAFETCYNVSANTVYLKDEGRQLHIHVLPRRPNDFPENDMVYDYLEKHCETLTVDSISGDVVQEVKVLRSCLSTL